MDRNLNGAERKHPYSESIIWEMRYGQGGLSAAHLTSGGGGGKHARLNVQILPRTTLSLSSDSPWAVSLRLVFQNSYGVSFLVHSYPPTK